MDATLESDVLRAGNGDEAAFARLVDRTANTVCSIALAIVRNVEASEDIAQEAFLAAWSNLKTLRNPASFLPWLRQVTRNQAHLWRREHHREVCDDASLAAAVDARPSAAEHLLAHEERRVLADVLDQLPDEAREVLVLYYREDSSSRHVSQLLGISEQAVRQRLSRSRALVRVEMLQRFGRTVARTAPGAAFAAAIGSALTFAAPTASAAVVVASSGSAFGKVAAATVVKASLLGGLLGWFGVMMGMHHLQPYFDDQEERELMRFRNIVLVVVTIGCVAVTLSMGTAMRLLITIQTIYFVIGYLYFFRLPRILERRMEWEKSVNPEAAKQSRRQWMWATIGRAMMAALAGAMMMAMVIRGI
ncbi:MAG TPA: sigma-70 family RNA polymerase sigma factor [Thermoanaerobaculia bacterium]|nr:sigma-70 family RNA polymerase sigma factor [Thermoanaerobaculia bacterium]